MQVAAKSMKQDFPRRFYKEAAFEKSDVGYELRLDGRSAKTPGRSALAMPTEETAALVVAEWNAQEEHIDPRTMPATRLANTAIDGVAGDPQAVKEDITRFAGADLLCYRADGPDGLVTVQRELWDPLLDWAQSDLGARFELAEGVMHITQPAETIAAFGVHVGAIDEPFRLAAVHLVTSLCGSAIIAMAVDKQRLSAEAAWRAAHADEDWQISQWGEDFEAQDRRAKRWLDMQAACAVIAGTQ
ncbi:MAG: ATP12 family protein [Pseudomonadota bacterium]